MKRETALSCTQQPAWIERDSRNRSNAQEDQGAVKMGCCLSLQPYYAGISCHLRLIENSTDTTTQPPDCAISILLQRKPLHVAPVRRVTGKSGCNRSYGMRKQTNLARCHRRCCGLCCSRWQHRPTLLTNPSPVVCWIESCA